MALAEDTLEDNEAWESYARNRGVTIKSYHAYNGIFKVKRWVELCHIGGQDITFSGGKSHYHNRMIEWPIRVFPDPDGIFISILTC